MGFFSVTFLFLSYQLTSFFGPVGFILANCTNMFLRIVFSGKYIRTQYQSVDLKPLDGIIPNRLFAITLIVLGITCKISEVTKTRSNSKNRINYFKAYGVFIWNFVYSSIAESSIPSFDIGPHCSWWCLLCLHSWCLGV